MPFSDRIEHSGFLPTPSTRRATHRLPAGAVFRQFLPTPSTRRATSSVAYVLALSLYFYPRPPRGGRPGTSGHAGPPLQISTHALHEEGDKVVEQLKAIADDFYPRPPRGGRLSTS